MTRYAPRSPRNIWTVPEGKIAIHNTLNIMRDRSLTRMDFACGSTIPTMITLNAPVVGGPISGSTITSAPNTGDRDDLRSRGCNRSRALAGSNASTLRSLEENPRDTPPAAIKVFLEPLDPVSRSTGSSNDGSVLFRIPADETVAVRHFHLR
jgi:hypothetical protein